MLELLLVWLGITGMVEGVNYSVYFKLINSIYSSGYKINYNNLLQCSEYFRDNHKYQNIFGKMLIPLVNAKYVNAKSVYFSKNIGKIIDKLALYGIVEGMSLEEYAEYLNKSCVDTALNITFPSREEKIEFLKYLFVEMNKVITLDENEKVNTLILSDDTVIRYTLSEENNQKKIKVINSNNEESTYRLTIIRKEFGLGISDDTTLKELKVLGYNIKFNPAKRDYTVKIKQEKTLVITAIPTSNRAEVFIRGNDELTGFSTVRVKVVAENGKFETYYIDIKKDAFNKTIEIASIFVGAVIIIASSCIIIIKKKNSANKAYFEE